MFSYLSRLNRQRLLHKHARAANARANSLFGAMSASRQEDVRAVMRRFEPMNTGHDLIRIGPDHDGGYLLPDDMEGIAALYSPGVSDTTGFDLEFAKLGVKAFLADGTIETPQDMHSNMAFEKMMLGDTDSEGVMTLGNWIARTAPPEGDLLLQMDIEGSEYGVVRATPSEVLQRFRIIVMELHGLDAMLLGDDLELLVQFLDKLGSTHRICHLHPNNCSSAVQISGQYVPPILELTYLRADRVTAEDAQEAEFPHPMDMPNMAELPDMLFDPFWRV